MIIPTFIVCHDMYQIFALIFLDNSIYKMSLIQLLSLFVCKD